MVLEFEFPDTGEGVTEGTFLEWLVEEGEEIEEDQTIAEVETDKAVVDVPAPSNGKVKELKADPGDKVDVGEVILVLETENERENEDTEKKENTEENTKQKERKTTRKDTSDKGNSDEVLALPKVRKFAEKENIKLENVEGSGPEGRITLEDVKNLSKTSGETNSGSSESNDFDASPSVRKLAREKNVDLEEIEGTGKGGKITRQDVLNPQHSSSKSESNIDEGRVERVELSNIRKSIGNKMKKSRFTAPHVTHVEKADITELVELREEKKDNVETHLTYLPFIMKAVLVGLKEYPDMNAELDEENDEIIRKNYYNFNIAVDTDRGLMVPVVENIESSNIVELSEKIQEKVEKTRNGEISQEEMSGGTFSITNLGVIGGKAFTPIINYPQVAILGIGKIEETAEVIEGEIKPRKTVKLSLSYDHRVVDGATAARFMNTVVENLEDPGKMLMEI